MYKFISKSEEDTINFANDFAKNLKVGDIIILSGELGSGKTKFTQGVLKYFGLENEISSPTFTIINEYHTDRFPIYHFDVYRLSDIDEFYAIGGEEYFSKGICIIEWGELIEDIIPSDYIKITFSKNLENSNCRILDIFTTNNKLNSLVEEVCN